MTQLRRQIELRLGKAGTPIASLLYAQQGRREYRAVAYAEAWLTNPGRFNFSADLQLAMGSHSPI